MAEVEYPALMCDLTPAQVEELRWGAVAVGPASTGPDMPNPYALGEGEHVNWGLRVRASGDRWVMGIRDQSGQPRHAARTCRSTAPCNGAGRWATAG